MLPCSLPFSFTAVPAAKSDLFERAVAFVAVMKVRRRVVGDKDIDQAVVVEVAGDDAETVITVRVGDARLL